MNGEMPISAIERNPDSRRVQSVSIEMAEELAAEGNDFLGRWRISEATQHRKYVDSGRVSRPVT